MRAVILALTNLIGIIHLYNGIHYNISCLDITRTTALRYIFLQDFGLRTVRQALLCVVK